MEKSIIPVFFATDDNYAPFLGTAIMSLLDNASKDYFYKIHILTTGFNDENSRNLLALKDDKSEIIFEDMTKVLKTYGNKFHLRNYYSAATYYRLFIAELFTQYDRAFYFDSDMIFLGDVSELYNVELGDNLIGGVMETVMQIPVFGVYSERVLGINRNDYINAGMLLMDLKGLREFELEKKFLIKLSEVTYAVAQDQDYLNVLLAGKILMLDQKWNLTASNELMCADPKIIHFKLNFRPWHYKGIVYEDRFWHYAERSGYHDFLRKHYENYSFADRLNDKFVMERLAEMAMQDILKYAPDLTKNDVFMDVSKLNP